MQYRELIAWQKGMDLSVLIFKYTERLPDSQRFVFVPQLQKAVISIPLNIAEGYGRSSKADFARFIDIALGSAREVQTQLELCERLGFADATTERQLADEVGKILFGLAKSLRPPKSSP
ncbi:MAG: four helix bundle protein [Armatimonadota bacterium]